MMIFLLAVPMALLADDDPESAGVLVPNGSVSGSMNFEHHIDWYKFELPEEGSIKLTATPSGGLDLYDVTVFVKPEGSFYTRASVNCAERQVLVLSEDAYKAGTYWVRVQRRYSIWDEKIGGAGSYTLHLDFTPNPYPNDAEPNDTWDQATRKLAPGETVYGHIGYFYSGNGDKDKEDWYMIEVPSDGKVTLKATPLGTTFIARLELWQKYSPDNETDIRQRMVASADSLVTIEGFRLDCKPGTYWVHLYMNYSIWTYTGCGAYTFTYNFTPDPLENDAEPNDTWDQATRTVAIGETVTGHLGYFLWESEKADNEDWYMIQVPEEGVVELTTDQNGTMFISEISLWTPDPESEEKANQRNHAGSGEAQPFTLKVLSCKAGTYYVRVVKYYNMWVLNTCGSYTLNYKFTPNAMANDPEPNNSTEEAVPLSDGQTVTGRLGYFYYAYGPDMDQEDWYKITVTEPKNLVFRASLENDTPLNATFKLVDAEGRWLVNYPPVMNKENISATLEYEAKEAGTYYLCVARVVNIWTDMGQGGYTLSYNVSTDVPSVRLDATQSRSILRTDGTYVTSGQGALPTLPAGIYIIRQGGTSHKMILK